MGAIDENPALTIGLQAAVPLWILQLSQLAPDHRDHVRQRWAEEAAEQVAYRGDTLQYGSKKRGEAAAVFNALARGLAAGAYQPGGIAAFGEHWCVNHGECVAADRDAAQPLAVVEPAQPTGPTFRGRPITDVHLPEVA